MTMEDALKIADIALSAEESYSTVTLRAVAAAIQGAYESGLGTELTGACRDGRHDDHCAGSVRNNASGHAVLCECSCHASTVKPARDGE